MSSTQVRLASVYTYKAFSWLCNFCGKTHIMWPAPFIVWRPWLSKGGSKLEVFICLFFINKPQESAIGVRNWLIREAAEKQPVTSSLSLIQKFRIH